MVRASGDFGARTSRPSQWGRLGGAVALCLVAAGCSSNTTNADPRAGDTPGGTASATSAAASPQGFAGDITAVQKAMDDLVNGDVVPGVVVLLRHRTQTRILLSGVADAETHTPVSAEHVFRIGSITKPMVAVAVLKLVERGKLALDDTVESRVPRLVPHGDRITIAQLLNHSSGLFNYTDLPRFSSAPAGEPPPPRGLVRLGTSQPPVFAPGHGANYSNTGYIVLGLILERVTHEPLATILEREVFTPAHMTATSFGAPQEGAPFAHGYDDGTDVTAFPLGWAWAAGAVVSNAHDVAEFFTSLLFGHLLRSDLVARMKHADVSMPENGLAGYGLGLGQAKTVCGTAWGHEGDLPGFVSAAWTNPSTDRQVVVLANASVGGFGVTFQRVLDNALCGAQ